ncbi:LysR family transcriptional regulator [Reinekea sp.]|uniref:LysR family transcriptional regulator n=1 Tax=Reinekea sp. TaxID=1970455 RepID=UPI00257BA119|nr:LysR family transcriptional regulator [Reinekea sp.]
MKIISLNFRHLRAFKETAQLHSVKAAAENIFLTQSAVTQAIARLETYLGMPLFLRRHNGMFLTDAGDLYLIRVTRALNYLKQGVREALRSGERIHPQTRSKIAIEDQLSHVQVRTLLALLQTTSYSTAARHLGVSQPSVYRAAGDLEDLLNLRLFEKTSIGISLTKAARRLTRFAQLALRELDLAQYELGELNGTDTTKITVGSMPLARTYILPAAINRLAQLKPDIRIEIVEGPYDDQLQRLLRGELDLLIGALRIPLPSTDIEQETLFLTPLSIVGRAQHPLTQSTQPSLAELGQYGWVVPRQGTPARAMFDQLIAAQQPAVYKGLIECSSQIVIRQLLLDSNRLTFISRHQIKQEEELGLMTVIDFDLANTDRPIGITTRKDWHPSTTQKLFLAIVRNLSSALTDSES